LGIYCGSSAYIGYLTTAVLVCQHIHFVQPYIALFSPLSASSKQLIHWHRGCLRSAVSGARASGLRSAIIYSGRDTTTLRLDCIKIFRVGLHPIARHQPHHTMFIATDTTSSEPMIRNICHEQRISESTSPYNPHYPYLPLQNADHFYNPVSIYFATLPRQPFCIKHSSRRLVTSSEI
jgi:hypothetical protein